MIQLLWRTAWRFLKTLGIKLPYDPVGWHIPLLGIYPEETVTEKDTCNSMFIAALFTIAGTWKDEWVKKLWYLYTVDFYSVIKRNTFD